MRVSAPNLFSTSTDIVCRIKAVNYQGRKLTNPLKTVNTHISAVGGARLSPLSAIALAKEEAAARWNFPKRRNLLPRPCRPLRHFFSLSRVLCTKSGIGRGNSQMSDRKWWGAGCHRAAGAQKRPKNLRCGPLRRDRAY